MHETHVVAESAARAPVPPDAAAPAVEEDQLWQRVAEAQKELTERLKSSAWKRGKARDPEYRKILLRLLACLHEARRMGDRFRGADERAALESLLDEPIATLEMQAAIEVLDAFDQLLISVGDDGFLRNLFELELYRARKNAAEGMVGRAAGPYVSWIAYFGDVRPDEETARTSIRLRPVNGSRDADDGGTDAIATFLERQELVVEQPQRGGRREWESLVDEGAFEEIRWRLAALRWARTCEFRLHRARQAMRERALVHLAPLLALLTVGLALGIGAASDDRIAPTILVSAIAGALGGTMAGVLKLRDHVSRIGDLRSLHPALYVQPLLGAAAGLILLLAIVGGFFPETPEQAWAKYGLLAFGAGFSEPFFLGLVGKIAMTGQPDRPPSSP